MCISTKRYCTFTNGTVFETVWPANFFQRIKKDSLCSFLIGTMVQWYGTIFNLLRSHQTVQYLVP